MLSMTWSRVAVGAIAGAAMVGAAGYRRKVSAMPNWKERAREEAFRRAFNNPPSNYHGELFEPTLVFPKKTPPEDYRELPFMRVDFRQEPEKYMQAVIDYCFEGNTECDFRVQNNKVRPWYSAPWLATRYFGREPIHGMTMERPAEPGYLATTDKRWIQTWSVGFYNAYGGYTIGRFWKDPGKPTLTENVTFPPGTVAFKLLFTEATERDIPALKGAKVWEAAIAMPTSPIPPTASQQEARTLLANVLNCTDRGPNPYPLRLIQVDVMVRDPRSNIGWLFGSFMYNKDQPYDTAAHPGEAEWRRLVPVSLQWGNDPDLTPEMYHGFGKRPEESWTSPRVKELKLLPKGRPYLGYLDRTNGIVDSFISCCASCHSTSSIPAPKAAPKPPDTPQDTPDTMTWFRNVQAGQPFKDGVLSLDYSLQLRTGVSGFKNWLSDNPEPGGLACWGVKRRT
ncbi:PREDICTED: uncharacterized protein LOC109466514 [Branchiostoma belcheri]|uniref:Uncharacterized protein LOC109466514 n=1 Tax=Branchiostoma belcheri TaxID=7741 RepID=A0A6P4Y5S6_BRABE|nr:PREDICTED: uncharacterized protein LOC109466514 [Branchiostoma belcheri]